LSSPKGRGTGWQGKFSHYLVGEANEQGEHRAYCPLHEDPETSKTPSASFNFKSGLFQCFGGCGGLTLSDVWSAVREEQRGTVHDMQTAREKKARRAVSLPTKEEIAEWHEELLNHPRELSIMRTERGLKVKTLREFEVGWYQDRYTIPVYDLDGELVNVRRYKAHASQPKDKMVSWAEGTGQRRLFLPEVIRDNEEIVLTEGELDAIIGRQYGFPCFSHTAGATAWNNTWNPLFAGKVVFIVYDVDDAGRQGARKVAFQLAKVAKAVYIVALPLPNKGDDLTNYFVDQGYTAKDFQALLDQARKNAYGTKTSARAATSKPRAATLEQSQSTEMGVVPLQLVATVAGKVTPPYAAPRRVELLCDMSYGDKCKSCPMQAREGQHSMTFDADDEFLLKFLDVNQDAASRLLKVQAEAPPTCPRIEIETTESWTLEDIVVVPAVDSVGEEVQNPISRRVYNVGHFNTPINQKVRLVAKNLPDPRNQRLTLQAWECEPLSTDLDNFELTPEMHESLKIFQPKQGQSPLEKMEEIAADLEANVTHIYGRDLLHMAYDVAWHSVMDFRMGGTNVGKGWIELLVVGDTRTGKSEAATRMLQHYRSGVLKSCEGATFAGLVGGAQQVGSSWMVMWGTIPLNDRRLVVLDEFSGIADKDIIGQMSSVRSSGKAQITKIVSQETSARTRLIWISNPDDGRSINDMPRGAIEAVQSLVKNPEDIARFDLAMSAARADVDSKVINTTNRDKVEHRYTDELCAQLLGWVWSRHVENADIPKDVEDYIMDRAEIIGKRYVPEPPLIQAENVRVKLARIACAIAARLYSTEDGVNLAVDIDHVDAAEELIERLYGQDSFGYRNYSRRVLRDREQAEAAKKACRKWLRLNVDGAYVALLSVVGGDFRVRDFADFAGMSQEEGQQAVRDLQTMKMVRRMSKGYIRMNPLLVDLVKELEDKLDRD
jgi:hypothetical protein